MIRLLLHESFSGQLHSINLFISWWERYSHLSLLPAMRKNHLPSRTIFVGKAICGIFATLDPITLLWGILNFTIGFSSLPYAMTSTIMHLLLGLAFLRWRNKTLPFYDFRDKNDFPAVRTFQSNTASFGASILLERIYFASIYIWTNECTNIFGFGSMVPEK